MQMLPSILVYLGCCGQSPRGILYDVLWCLLFCNAFIVLCFKCISETLYFAWLIYPSCILIPFLIHFRSSFTKKRFRSQITNKQGLTAPPTPIPPLPSHHPSSSTLLPGQGILGTDLEGISRTFQLGREMLNLPPRRIVAAFSSYCFGVLHNLFRGYLQLV